MRKPTRKDHIISAAIIAFFIVLWLGALLLGPTQVVMPADVRPQTTPSTSQKVPRAAVPVEPVPSTVQKPQETVIYVTVTKVPKIWAVTSTLADWNMANKYVEFKQTTLCPVAEPCLRIKMEKLDRLTTGETRFQDDGYSIDLVLNSRISNDWIARSTTCHELGHVQGLPHIKGTVNTCMVEIDGFFRTRPTTLDSRLVNSYGPWGLEKMYELSGKDVDVRGLPR